MTAKMIGRYIVTDPEICHGKPTFRGTRIMVVHVLEQIAEGMAWESIIAEWRNSINKEAIAEAVRLAGQAALILLATAGDAIMRSGSHLTHRA